MNNHSAARLFAIAIALACTVANAVAGTSSWHLTDEFGRVVDSGASSAWEGSDPPMEFPYDDVTGRIVVDSCRATLSFSVAPNLRGGTIEHGMEYRDIAVLLDDGRRKSWSVMQRLGSKDMRVIGGEAVRDLMSAGTVAVSLPWARGRGIFSWDLTGSGDAIRAACKDMRSLLAVP